MFPAGAYVVKGETAIGPPLGETVDSVLSNPGNVIEYSRLPLGVKKTRRVFIWIPLKSSSGNVFEYSPSGPWL